MKKIVLLLLLLCTFVFAQEPWQHQVGPVFSEPFDRLLLPWSAEGVQPVEINACWRGESPPFYGQAWSYWCYALEGTTANDVAHTLGAAFEDLGLPGMVTPSFRASGQDGQHGSGMFLDDVDRTTWRYWVFQHDGETYVGLATDG